MIRLLDLGVDGIMTDRADVLRDLLRRARAMAGRNARTRSAARAAAVAVSDAAAAPTAPNGTTAVGSQPLHPALPDGSRDDDRVDGVGHRTARRARAPLPHRAVPRSAPPTPSAPSRTAVIRVSQVTRFAVAVSAPSSRAETTGRDHVAAEAARGRP